MADSSAPQPPRRRGPGKPFPKGVSPNPGGRPKKLVEIERMLDAEHRTPENMRTVFERLKALALGEPVEVPVPGGDGETTIELRADSRFMALYLDRILGPVKDLAIDLSDAPDEVLRWAAENLAPTAN